MNQFAPERVYACDQDGKLLYGDAYYLSAVQAINVLRAVREAQITMSQYDLISYISLNYGINWQIVKEGIGIGVNFGSKLSELATLVEELALERDLRGHDLAIPLNRLFVKNLELTSLAARGMLQVVTDTNERRWQRDVLVATEGTVLEYNGCTPAYPVALERDPHGWMSLGGSAIQSATVGIEKITVSSADCAVNLTGKRDGWSFEVDLFTIQ
ncbi:hypothetical protein KC878_01000 [Candidatus Saccharibacteria bacterium]|nr:hypothetical protein [Candidatus Saccharibacteria bacterium]MCB9821562.1 hypothetical protein [Candidatus Nomurabacteria bacterium]